MYGLLKSNPKYKYYRTTYSSDKEMYGLLKSNPKYKYYRTTYSSDKKIIIINMFLEQRRSNWK